MAVLRETDTGSSNPEVPRPATLISGSVPKAPTLAVALGVDLAISSSYGLAVSLSASIAPAFARLVGCPAHPAAEMLPMMSDTEIDELAADIRTHGLVEPIVLWADNTQQKETGQLWGPEHCPRYLLDGRSRLMALDRLGYQWLDDLRCRTKQPQSAIRILPAWKRERPSAAVCGAWPWRYLDPWAYVLSVNVRRRHLTQEQRRQIVEDMVRRRPDLTDRALAKIALADHKTVAARRAEAERSGAIPQIPPAERIEEDGRRSRARKTRYEPLSGEADWAEDPPRDWRADPKFRFHSPVKPNAPKRAAASSPRAAISIGSA